MDRYHEMRMFRALSQRPSLASAARFLNVSGPTLVRAIARLESRLGVPLVVRSTRGVALTEAGAAFMADCSRILDDIEQAEVCAKGLHVQAQGSLRVHLPLLFSRYVMAPMLTRYMDLYPQVRLFAHYHDRVVNLHEEGVDVAVVMGHLPSSSLIARPVGQVRSIVCASPAYLAIHGEPLVPEDLLRHRLIAVQAHQDKVQWPFQVGAETSLFKARPHLGCSTVQAAISAAAQGAGLVRCESYPLYDYLQSGRLRPVLGAYETASLPVQVVYREGLKAPIRVRSLVDFLVEHLREHPAL
ncbi:LysR substrate-binding domain-containing protein [Pseudomonas sp. FP597]|uniref:LysR substrate-binding domain-containing protein n=1 Tax=Pseudomonas sp. FP597 TaxID=2954096 RepID=UPI00273308E9|nr:LysR substrate-binding domain-containing protein [Pseudomonas sp. FP597]WLI04903.1 LysR substrate-binding domain-containing protein [Pseudomonas sp. FP597]